MHNGIKGDGKKPPCLMPALATSAMIKENLKAKKLLFTKRNLE
jgi:hypothetical protein